MVQVTSRAVAQLQEAFVSTCRHSCCSSYHKCQYVVLTHAQKLQDRWQDRGLNAKVGHGDARQNIWILPASLPCLFLTTTLYGAAALLAVSARSVHLTKLVTKPCFGPALSGVQGTLAQHSALGSGQTIRRQGLVIFWVPMRWMTTSCRPSVAFFASPLPWIRKHVEGPASGSKRHNTTRVRPRPDFCRG